MAQPDPVDAEIRRLKSRTFHPPASFAEVARLSSQRVAAMTSPAGADLTELRELFRDSLQDVVRRMAAMRSVDPRTGKAPFSLVQAQSVRAQLEQAIHDLTDRIGDWQGVQRRKWAARGVADLARDVRSLEGYYQGVSVPLSIEEAARFRGLVDDTERSILRQHPRSVAAYGDRLIHSWETWLSTAVLAKTPYMEAIDRVHAAAQQPGLLQGHNHGAPTFERWRAERIVRTELMGAYNGARHNGMVALRSRDFGGDMQKVAKATFDDRTDRDSFPVHNQIRKLEEEFEDGDGRRYLYPPGRPNDRETSLPWRATWGTDGEAEDEGGAAPAPAPPPKLPGPKAAKPKPAPKPPPAPPRALTEQEIRQAVAGWKGHAGVPSWCASSAMDGQVTEAELLRNRRGLEAIWALDGKGQAGAQDLGRLSLREIEIDRAARALRTAPPGDRPARPSLILAAAGPDHATCEAMLESGATVREVRDLRAQLRAVVAAEKQAEQLRKQAARDQAAYHPTGTLPGSLVLQQARRDRLAEATAGWERVRDDMRQDDMRRGSARAELLIHRARAKLDASGLTDHAFDTGVESVIAARFRDELLAGRALDARRRAMVDQAEQQLRGAAAVWELAHPGVLVQGRTPTAHWARHWPQKRHDLERAVLLLGDRQLQAPDAWKLDAIAWGLDSSAWGRASANSWTNRIKVSLQTEGPVLAHEFGHHLEYRSPGADRLAFAAWLRTRAIARRRPLQWLGPGYGPDEQAFSRLLPEEYSAKVYAGGHTELMSMLTQDLACLDGPGRWFRSSGMPGGDVEADGRNAARLFFGLVRGL